MPSIFSILNIGQRKPNTRFSQDDDSQQSGQRFYHLFQKSVCRSIQKLKFIISGRCGVRFTCCINESSA